MAGRMSAVELLKYAAGHDISDIFITSGCPVMVKKNGIIEPLSDEWVMPESAAELIEGIFTMSQTRSFKAFLQNDDSDFSVSMTDTGRFRVSAFRQRGSLAAVVRVVKPSLPDYKALHIPDTVIDLHTKTHGLVLVTGPAGAGKSTTLAAIIDQINEKRNCHILTLEDPIEYLHAHKKSIVNQREIGTDASSYASALRTALRQSPDVILVGEMRDLETVSIALTAAETGTLVLSTIHTLGAANSIDRIIDVFPAEQQRQIRVQLSMALEAVVSQQLLPSPTKGRLPVFEIMTATPAIRNIIREGKTHQLDNVIYSGENQGMMLMDYSIAEALKRGDISRDIALTFCGDKDIMMRMTGNAFQ